MTTLYLYHSTTFDLVADEDPKNKQTAKGEVLFQGEVYESLGTRQVNSALAGPEGETRHKIALDTPGGGTFVQVSPDFTGTPTEFTHLAEMLLDRHAPGEAITGIYSPDDEAFAKRLAALMGVEFLATEPDQPAPGGATLPTPED